MIFFIDNTIAFDCIAKNKSILSSKQICVDISYDSFIRSSHYPDTDNFLIYWSRGNDFVKSDTLKYHFQNDWS